MKNIFALYALFIIVLSSCDFSKKREEKEVVQQDAKEKTASQKTNAQDFLAGKTVYDDFCITCHMPNGQGVPNTFPPLAKSDYLMTKRKESIHSIKYGLNGEITVNGKTYNNVMTPLGLSSKEIADVMNYITNSWGNKNEDLVTEEEVSKIQR